MTASSYHGCNCSLTVAHLPAVRETTDRHIHRKTNMYEPEHTEALSLIIRQDLVMGSPVLVCCSSLTSGREKYKAFKPC